MIINLFDHWNVKMRISIFLLRILKSLT